MPGFDAFHFFRYLLAVFVTSYAVIAMGQFVRQWRRDTAAAAREEALLRTYLVVHLLRVRIRPFLRDLLEIAALLVVLLILIWRH